MVTGFHPSPTRHASGLGCGGAGVKPRYPEVTAVRVGVFRVLPAVLPVFGVWVFGYFLGGDGQGDSGLDEVEGAALLWGGVGDFVDLDSGAMVTDPVAG
jgi:hypothetical protein